MEILDTTLRDGAQCEGISFSLSDKMKIVKALDNFGVDLIEAGNPFSNPKDAEFFKEAKKLRLLRARLVAFGSTRRKGVMAEDDEGLKALIGADTPCVAIFGKCSKMHVQEILKVSLDENIEMVGDTVRFVKSFGKEVIFDAEHFYDGYKDSPEYALKVVEKAILSGADTVCLCDTNGGTMPDEIYAITKDVVGRFGGVRIGTHFHNDTGCAVANACIAVKAGAEHIQGTVNGIGERCGNTDLISVIANLNLKLGIDTSSKIESLTSLSRAVGEISNVAIDKRKPYVGSSAFAHKGGMHIDGVNKLSESFEHVRPESVGNRRRFLLSEVSGKNALLLKLNNISTDGQKDDPILGEILAKLKELEAYGYQFEGADASFELLVKRMMGEFKEHFKLVMYKTNEECPAPEGERNSFAFVKISVGDVCEVSAAQGNGPVNALDTALRKALKVFYPSLENVELVDYKVRVLDTGSATGSKVRVLIESGTDGKRWTTVGVSTDIIEASWSALVDSIEYYLSKENI